MYLRILLGILAVCTPLIHSQAAEPPQDPQKIHARTSVLDDQVAALQEQLTIEMSVLERHRLSLEDAQAQLRETQQEHTAVNQAASGDASDAIVRELRRVELRLQRHTAKVERYLEREAESQNAVETLSGEIAELQMQLQQQRNQLTRLSQLPVPQQNAKPPSRAGSVVPRETSNRDSQQRPTKVSAPVSVQSANQSPATWPHLNDANDADIAYARGRLQELQVLKRAGKLDEAPLPSVEIEARLAFGRADMEYLGDDLFGIIKPMKAGRQSFKLFNQEHWFTIPESDDGAQYRILFDVSSISNARLILFKEALIEE